MHIDPQATPCRYRFTLGPNAPIVTGTVNTSNGGELHVVVGEIYVQFETYTLEVGTPVGAAFDAGAGGAGPTGADLVVDIDRSTDGGSTWSSIFGGNQAVMPQLADGRVSQLTTDTRGGYRCNFGDQLRTNVLQVGSTVAGQNVVLTCTGYCLEN